MANIITKVNAELDPRRPVQEVCAVIMALVPFNPGQEAAILRGVIEAAEDRLRQLEPKEGGEEHAEPVHEPERKR